MRNPGIMFCHQFTGGVVTFRFVKNKDMCVCVICHVYVCKLLGIHAYIDVHCIHTCCFLIWLQYIDNLYNYCYYLYYCWWVVSSIMTVSVFDCDSKRFFCLLVFI